ncbi:MAG TPA: toprim domain-containing protein [Anaerolineaceae bacterium]|nr:toprim domain-containing protein [Anaerolineaceae bacterium]
MPDNADFVEKVKQLNRLEVVVEQDGYHLGGRGRYRRCKEHDSLIVDLNKQTYHWNQSGEWGDVISWVMARKRTDFKDAVEDLCRRAGMPEPSWGGDGQARIAARVKEDAFNVAAKVFQKWLRDDPEALEFVKARGWSDTTIDGAMLGYTGGNSGRKTMGELLKKELTAAGISTNSPAAVALIGYGGDIKRFSLDNNIQVRQDWIDQGYIPGFVGRDMIVYPHLIGGRVRYFSGRGVHEKFHYNLPGELVGPRQPYFNAEWSAIETSVVIVEGQADAITLGQWGIPAAALAGTNVDEELLKRFEAHKTFYVGLDSDKAGKINEWKIAKALGPMARLVEWKGIMTFTQFENAEGESKEIKDANDLLRALSKSEQSHENQMLGIQEALTKSPTLAEAMAHWAGLQSGADRDDALRKAMDVIVKMDELSLAQYSAALAKTMRISSRDFNRMVKTTLDVAKKKDEKGESFNFTLGGVYSGWMVEYLYDLDEHKSSLAWKDPEGKIGSGTEVVIEGQKYVAMPPTDTFKNQGILFPSNLGTLKTTGELVGYIEAYINSVYLLNDRLSGKIMAYYVVLTWLYDCFNTIPYLRAMGEAGAGKSELMRRVGMVCYRLMIANGAGTAASLFRSVERYRGTVFIDEADLERSDASADVVKFLNLGAMRNNPIWRLEEVIGEGGKKEYQERMYTTFCPKLIAMRKDFRDDAVGSRSLTFKIQPRETMELLAAKVPLEINNDMRARAQALRNLLLRWRLEHWQPEIPVDPAFYDLDISSRLNQVTGPLMAVARDDPTLQAEMRRFLREYYAELTVTKSMTIPARVIEALWKVYKYPDLRKEMIVTDADGERMLVGQVTRIANEIIDEMNSGGDEKEDEQQTHKNKKDELSPQRIGRLIREELQLRVSGRTNKGFYVYWDQVRMEAVAKRYGINVEEIGPKPGMKQETLA